MRAHGLRWLLKLLDAGILAMVNSDDPAYFGGSINRNFEAVIEALPVTREHLKTLALNSVEASFVSKAQKAEFAAQVEAFFAQTP